MNKKWTIILIGGILLVILVGVIIYQRNRLLPLVPKYQDPYYREQGEWGRKYKKDILYITFKLNIDKKQAEVILAKHDITIERHRLDGSYVVHIPQTKDFYEMEKIIKLLQSFPEITSVEKVYIILY